MPLSPCPIIIWWHHSGENAIMEPPPSEQRVQPVSRSVTATHSRRDLIEPAHTCHFLFLTLYDPVPPPQRPNPNCHKFLLFVSPQLSHFSSYLPFLASPPSLVCFMYKWQVYWKHFSFCVWQVRCAENKFRIWGHVNCNGSFWTQQNDCRLLCVSVWVIIFICVLLGRWALWELGRYFWYFWKETSQSSL